MGRTKAVESGTTLTAIHEPAPSAVALEQLPVAVIATDAAGRVIHWNSHAVDLFGWAASDVIGRDAVELLALTSDRARAEAVVEQIRAGGRWEGEFTVRRPDRSRVAVYVTTTPFQDPDGTPAGIVAVAVDISSRALAEEQREAALLREQAARAEGDLLHQIATAASGEEDLTGILSATLDRLGRLIAFTGGSIALVEGDELVLRAAVGPFASGAVGQRLPRGSGQSWRIIESGRPWLCDDLVAAGYHIRGLAQSDGPRAYLAIPLIWREETVGLLQIDSVSPEAFRSADLALMEAVAVALSGPIEVARRRAAEREALAASERAQGQLALLAEASVVLASSLDYPKTLGRVARLAVPALADYCIVDILEGGELRQIAVAHADLEKEPLLRELRRRFPFDADQPQGAAQVLRTGEPEVQNDIDRSWVELAGADERNRVAMEALQFRAYMVVPLVTRGEIVGTFSFVSTDPERRYGDQDLALAQDLGRRAAAAVELAQLFQASQESRALLGELLEQEQHLRTEAEFVRTRLAVLADASAVLASSLDYETTLRHLTEIAVREIADWCVVDIVEEPGIIRRMAVTHSETTSTERVDELLSRSQPASLEADTNLARVIRTGESLLLSEITDEMIAAASDDPEQAAMLAGLGMRSAMIVPLVARGRALGALSFVSTRADRTYEPAHLAFAEDLARRAATAVDTARLYSEMRNFRSTVDLTHDGVFMFDPETLRYFYANQGATDLTGYSRDELLEMTPLDLKPEFDERRLRLFLEPLIDGGTESTVVTTTQRRKDGRLISVEMLMQHVAPDGQRGRVVTIVRDISDRVEARARLQRLAESERARNAELKAIIRAMGDAVLVIQPDGVIAMSNPAADALFAGGPIATYDQLLDRFEQPEGKVPRLAADTRQGPVELRMVGPHDRWLEVNAYPVFTPAETLGADASEGTVLETILFMRDVSEVRRVRAMSDAFVGVLSHELRTPVTTIYGNSKLLGRTGRELDESLRRDVLGDIEVESERLYRLVEDLLVLARFGEGGARMGREPLLLQRIVPLVVRSEEGRWPSTTFNTEISPGMPTVQGDPTYVEQVVRNLIGNAAKYSGEGGNVRIVLDAEEEDVSLRVLDDGPGFAVEEATRLFELFYRSAGTATKASGAGIGLFVCRQLIESMGGRIWAQPRPEGGAEFGFALRVFNEESE